MYSWLISVFLILILMPFSALAFVDDCLDIFSAAEVPNTSFELTPLVTDGTIDVDTGNGYSMTIEAGENHDYDNIKANNNFTLSVSGTGTARLHLNGSMELRNGARINATGNPEDLVIYINGNLTINNNAIINALIWVNGNIEINRNGTTTGSLSANGNIDIGSHVTVYDASAVGKADFAGMCNGGASEPDITLDNISVNAGDDASFVFMLSESYSNDITIDYLTADGTAIAGLDYTAIAGTATILAGTTSTAVNVTTSAIGSGDFTLSVSNASAGNIINTEATATIIKSASLLADYRLDEPSWSGAADEVLDNTGNGLNGRSFNGAYTDNLLPAIPNNPGTCGYGEFDGVDDYLEVADENLLDVSSQLTLTAWVYPTKFGQQVIISKARRASGSNNYQLLLGAGNTLLFQYRSGGVDKSISTFTPVPINTWSHVAITYTDGEQHFYINGIETDTGNNTGLLDTNNETLDIGAERIFDSVSTGVFLFEGKIDEVRVYDGALTEAQVGVVAGESHPCPTATELVLEYRFEEPSWTGANNEVLDNSSNALHGTSVAGADTGDSFPDPAITGDPGTCRYGDFNYSAVQTRDDDLLDMSDTFTITAWVRHQAPAFNFFEDVIVTKGDGSSLNYRLSVQTDGDLRLSWNGGSLDSTSAIPDNGTWVHVAATYENGSQKLYINGIQDASSSSVGSLNINNSDVFIGRLSSGIFGRGFVGQIDEVRLYKGALSSSDVAAVFNETHPCNSFVDHFEIDTLDEKGITCLADEIVIKACADASCSVINPDAVEVDLFINNTFYKKVDVVGGSGTTTSYPFTTAGTASLSLAQTYQCSQTSSTPCNVEFFDSGFIFSDIPTQLSGKPSNIGFNAATLSIQAIEKDENTGSCQAAFPDDSDVEVNLSYACVAGDCQDELSLTNNTNSYNLTTVPLPKSLRFGSDSTATYTLLYPHAAKFKLHAQADIEVIDSDGNIEIKDFSGASDDFVERPFAFKLDFPTETDPFAIDAQGAKFKKAGEPFNMQATAMQWLSGHDANDDGVPDDFTAFNNATGDVNIAKYFTAETITVVDQDILLLPKLPADGGSGVNGILTQTYNAFSGTNSQVSNEYSYGEVGIIELHANLTSGAYLGDTVDGNIEGKVTNVGRFYPAYFIQTIATGNEGSLTGRHTDDLLNTCSMRDWVYTGQMTGVNGSIRYETSPTLTITAYNLANEVTKNYIEGFAKLGNLATDPNNKITFAQPISRHNDNSLPLSGDVSGIGTINVLGEGVVTYELPTQHSFVYTRNLASEVASFKANFELPYDEFKDSDEVTFKPTDTESYFVNPHFYQVDAAPPASAFDNTVDIYFGRWRMENSFAPETSNMPMAMFIEQFNDTEYVTHQLESCVIPVLANKDESGLIGSGGLALWDYRLFDRDTSDNLETSDTNASLLVGGTVFDEGVYRELIFSAPNNGLQGILEVEYQVPAWLQYDWNNDGAFTNNPTATLNFGIFRGNDRIIYQREIQP